MSTHADKTQENKSNTVTDSLTGQQSNSTSSFQFATKPEAEEKELQEPGSAPEVQKLRIYQEMADNSPQVQQMKAYQAMADNSPQVQQMKAYQAMVDNSPQVQQMKAYQAMVDNSPQVQQMKAYQAMADNYTAGIVQRKAALGKEDNLEPLQKKENHTGLPDNLKAGIENLSGISMDDVNVNYNSAKPAGLQAHAYAQGTDIHIAPGQEKHLPHEAWHVVQQKQGRVKPTVQMKGAVNVNDDAGLEREADVMGTRSLYPISQLKEKSSIISLSNAMVVQRFSDEENDVRRNRASQTTGTEMQLDHGISQDTLKEFHKVLVMVGSISKALRPEGYDIFMKKSASLFKSQDISVEGVNAFLNLRNNLTPGYKNTVGNPGSRFDPQIEVKGAEVSISEQTNALEVMERHMRSISRKVEIIRQINSLNESSTEKYRKELNDDFKHLNDSLDFLSKDGTVPEYNPNQWYDYGDKKVKKVPGTYLNEDNDLLNALATKKLRRFSPKTLIKFVNINQYDITKKRKQMSLKTETVPITVKIIVPESTWVHIYERHTIEYFAWDIQAVNTFWKEDPQKIFEDFDDAIAAELLLIIDRQIDMESEINKVKAGKQIDIEGNINEAGSDFFFQGTYLFEKMSEDEEFEKDELKIILKSFAPQSSEIAFVVLPSILNAKKPAL